MIKKCVSNKKFLQMQNLSMQIHLNEEEKEEENDQENIMKKGGNKRKIFAKSNRHKRKKAILHSLAPNSVL